MLVGRIAVPPLAQKYLMYLSSRFGFCTEVALTAYAAYAQCVEGFPCADHAYQVTPRVIQWFKENSEDIDLVREKAKLFDWLLSQLDWGLGGYNGPDWVANATRSLWALRTEHIFVGTNTAPADKLEAIRQASRLAELPTLVDKPIEMPV